MHFCSKLPVASRRGRCRRRRRCPPEEAAEVLRAVAVGGGEEEEVLLAGADHRGIGETIDVRLRRLALSWRRHPRGGRRRHGGNVDHFPNT